MSADAPSERDAIDLGDDHELVFSEFNGQRRVGANVIHKRPDNGEKCQGWVSFAGRAWAIEFSEGAISTWKVVQDEPLTLLPSLLCKSCGDHGFVTNGKWVRA